METDGSINVPFQVTWIFRFQPKDHEIKPFKRLIFPIQYVDVSKNRGKTPKMDGLFHGKPYFLMDDLGVSLFLETPM